MASKWRIGSASLGRLISLLAFLPIASRAPMYCHGCGALSDWCRCGREATRMLTLPAARCSFIHETDRAAGIVVADHEYCDNLLNTLPDAYQALARQGIYGDFFSFYLCDIVLKLNGKGGQPVYVKVAGQPTGRCAPK